jgi:hypothetical protein
MTFTVYEHGDGMGQLVEDVAPESYLNIGAWTLLRVAHREADIMARLVAKPADRPSGFPLYHD